MRGGVSSGSEWLKMDLESARSAGEELIVISGISTITSLHDGEGKKVVSEPALVTGVKSVFERTKTCLRGLVDDQRNPSAVSSSRH